MVKLELLLLGAPQIYVNGQVVTDFNTRKDQALLIYLAVTGTVHSRETLAGLLWSDLPEEKARRNLRHALSHLQKVIGLHWLETDHGVALTQNHPWSVDVQWLRSAGTMLTTSLPTAPSGAITLVQETLNQLLPLYRGEFLQGFYLRAAEQFEEWVLAQREELRLLFLRRLERLATHCLTLGMAEQGLAATHRLLQVEPWSEPAYCLQMQLLAQSGRRTEALAQYEICCKVLAAELAVAPMSETTALYQQIKAENDKPLFPPKTKPVSVPHQAQGSRAGPIPHNLITPLAGFVGRETEVAFIQQRLGAADCRLLTITGLGGIGKTSLAQMAAQRLLQAGPVAFPDGIYFVSLLDINAADDTQPQPLPTTDVVAGEAILRAIADQIGCQLAAGGSPAHQLQSYLRARRLLLILDNFEHLLAGAMPVVTLLTQAPQIKALITSRVRLNVRGESVLALTRLSLPTAAYHSALAAAQANAVDTIQTAVWQASEAVTMFVQRAQQVDPFFAVNAATLGPIGQICQLVEGLPLGIELAASMLPLLTCTALADALAGSLDVLAAETRDLPSAQRTLRAVFERSWRLLAPEEQQVLARLAIFPGSFRRDAAERITDATGGALRRLLDQSLLSKVEEERYVMHATVRTFAQQKLQQWPTAWATLQSRYAHFYLEELARLEQAQAESAYVAATEQIQADLDNVRTAWRWSVDQNDLALLAHSVDSLQAFYQVAGIYAEAIQLCEGALTMVRHAVALSPALIEPQRLLARLLCYTAQFYRLSPQLRAGEKGAAWAQEALALGQRLADPALQGLASHELARIAQVRYDFLTMCTLSEQACRYGRLANLPHLTAESLNDLGIALGMATHPLAGIQHFHEALACLRQRPNRALEVRLTSNLGLFNLSGHAYQAAYGYLQQRAFHPLFEDWVHVGDLLMALGAYREAQQEYAQGLVLAQTRSMPYWESWLYGGLGRLQRLGGDLAAAQATCRLALALAQKFGNHFVAQSARVNLGHLLAELGDFAAASHCYHQVLAHPQGPNWFARTADAQMGLAALALAQNEIASAVAYAEAALAPLHQHGLAAANEPFAVYWTCVRVFQAADDPRAPTVLATAYHQLQETAHQLEDKQLRRSFLENVVVNRKLAAMGQAATHTPPPPFSNGTFTIGLPLATSLTG
jgi:predicted ATPase/DNA-binding SARP family transcriptional activator/tetratricopeptide (TPR) repeat protein